MSDAPGNIAELRQRDPTAAERNRRYRRRKKRAAVTPVVAPETVPSLTSTVTLDKVETPVATVTHDSVTVDVAAIAAALAPTSVSGFFGVVGMTAIFTAEPVPVTLMSCTLEGSKLATAAWLTRTWRTAPLRLKLCLVVMVLALMVITTNRRARRPCARCRTPTISGWISMTLAW